MSRTCVPTLRLTCMVLGCSTLVWAEKSHQTDQDVLLTRVMQAIGLEDQLADAPAMMEAQLNARQGQLPPVLEAKMRQLFLEASQPETMRRSVRTSLQKQFNSEKFSAVLEQFSAPLFRKMVQCEIAGSSPSAATALQQFTAELQQHKPSPSRVALARHFNAVTGADDLLVQTSAAITQGLATSMAAAQGVAPSDMTPVEQPLEQPAAPSQRQVQEALLIRCLFTYRSVSDEEFAQYVKFYESPLGQWFTPLVNQALVHAFAEMADQAGRQLFEFVNTQHESGDSPSPTDTTP